MMKPKGGTETNPMIIKTPLVLMFVDDHGGVITHLHPRPGDTYKGYGLLACDLVRHISAAFKVSEDDVWEWVDKERNSPTTDIRQPS